MLETMINNIGDKKIRLILIRHGQTLANKKMLLQGASDGPLTSLGTQQAKILGEHLRAFQIDHLISSDLIRAVRTAEAVARHQDLEIEVTPLAREWNCGIWDGKTAQEFLSMLAESGKPVSAFEPEGGETLAEVRQRACDLIEKIISSHSGETVAVSSHGDFLRMFVGCLLKLNVDQANRFFFNNASYSLLEQEADTWKAIALNRLPSPDWESFS